MADIALLFVEIRGFISCDLNTRSILDGLDFYVWEMFQQGAVNRFIFVLILEQQYF